MKTKEDKIADKAVQEIVSFIDERMDKLGRGYIFIPGLAESLKGKGKKYIPNCTIKYRERVEFLALIASTIVSVEETLDKEEQKIFRSEVFAFMGALAKNILERR